MKIPLIETVQVFEKRILTREYPVEQFLTSEGKILRVDFYAKWRIPGVAQFYGGNGGGRGGPGGGAARLSAPNFSRTCSPLPASRSRSSASRSSTCGSRRSICRRR